ncbi:carbamate kinase [Gemmatimonadota bacterium Y43]|uniref:carbamate kinase n=1 Tax=Gaopeijia maritima TaxID=3119007 RepID=UPI003285A1FA
MSLVVVALGGNALLRRGEPLTLEAQEANARVACRALAPLAEEHDLVITHGNGPQVGLLALRSEAYDATRPQPLDVLGAESEGMIGYLLERGLRSVMPGRPVAALLTQVSVDADDPAFGRPTKPIGPVYDEDEAHRLADERKWAITRDGEGWRRVVPSPRPRGILELETIRLLVEHGVVPICAGGGGVPVTVGIDGRVAGVDGVIDKDATAALLARQLQADLLVLLTDVDGVMLDHGSPEARVLRRVTPEALRDLELPESSMGPKAAACADFVESTGGRAAIGRLDRAAAVVRGEAGTQVEARPRPNLRPS